MGHFSTLAGENCLKKPAWDVPGLDIKPHNPPIHPLGKGTRVDPIASVRSETEGWLRL
ncbi:MAG TPA: hypothetical protein IGS52_05685 [Oscillatoriaceae cyanobacterium M33_DOE_052]|nr:hypothetical protein [Oscillatoriaceae cyanobacterium M33_DOE_052]